MGKLSQELDHRPVVKKVICIFNHLSLFICLSILSAICPSVPYFIFNSSWTIKRKSLKVAHMCILHRLYHYTPIFAFPSAWPFGYLGLLICNSEMLNGLWWNLHTFFTRECFCTSGIFYLHMNEFWGFLLIDFCVKNTEFYFCNFLQFLMMWVET